MTSEFTPDERIGWLNKQHKIPASAVMAIEDQADRLLVVKTTYKPYWSMPGGIIDPGESPRGAAIREVKEEIGLSFEASEVRFLGTVFRTSSAIDTHQFVFGAKVSDGLVAEIIIQEEEIADYALVSREQILKDAPNFAPIVVRWAKNDVPYYSEELIETL